MARVELIGVTKRFGGTTAVDSVDLDIADGELMVFVGPSGCGKSTTLRMVAGLETISSGTVRIGERDVTRLEPRHRDVAMVFQNYALYAHMNVFRNLAFGLRMRGTDRAEIEARVHRAADMLGIRELLERKPAQLSGGQRQRVALGRALVREPEVFLLDEPLSNLDARLRVRMRAEIARLHAEIGVSMIYVTHDQVEAMTLGDRIAVMKDGRVQQVGAPLELYDRPANVFVASFIGSPEMNLLPGETVVEAGGAMLRLGEATIPLPGILATRPGPATAGLRPEHLAPAPHGLPVRVTLVENMGAQTLLLCDGPSGPVNALVARDDRLRAGDCLTLGIDPAHHHLFDPESGARLDIRTTETVPADLTARRIP